MDQNMVRNKSTFENLPDLVLEEIFSNLTVPDVMKMWDISPDCRDFLGPLPFYRHDAFKIIYLADFNGKDSCIPKFKNGIMYFKLTGIGFILRYLRVFWHEINMININCLGATASQQEAVFSYILKYRRHQVKNLGISNLSVDLNLPLESFPNVVTLRIRSSYIGDYLGNISSLFPNVQSIDLIRANTLEDSQSKRLISCVYPKLRFLKISPHSISETHLTLMKILNPNIFFIRSSH